MPRAGGETAQVMAIGEDGSRMRQVAGCVARAYRLSESDARQIVDHQIDTRETQWARRVRRSRPHRGRSHGILATSS
jgi:hypothetical protein